MYVHIYELTYICMNVHTYVCTFMLTHIHPTTTHVHMYVPIHTYICTYMYTHTYVGTYAKICLSFSLSVCILSTYLSAHLLRSLFACTGLEILAFPCNQFGGQEPGSNEKIQSFACTKFNAEFPIFDKVGVLFWPSEKGNSWLLDQ